MCLTYLKELWESRTCVDTLQHVFTCFLQLASLFLNNFSSRGSEISQEFPQRILNWSESPEKLKFPPTPQNRDFSHNSRNHFLRSKVGFTVTLCWACGERTSSQTAVSGEQVSRSTNIQTQVLIRCLCLLSVDLPPLRCLSRSCLTSRSRN